ncbi:MFS general substrate transporter [Linderina pennispora]|uniref:MFS general substrate transporter n=1 Tax=Linderina pennispora TaxID=61395 RepID=A0A1Y1VYL6_9FUNG|nr:MFS general substrate transporter [Linderina pennispora]ORX66360.1 MFS general substrate transporter [Linderina pennispora]
MAIPAGILIQFCYGSVYAWSIFNGPINQTLADNPDRGRAEVTFYIALGILGVTGAIFGPWIESSHPQKSGIIGMVMFFAGHITTALAIQVKMFSMLYFGYGFIAGIGLGIGYVSTIDAVSKWWPKARGTAAGCAVMGFGGGSLAFSFINKRLIDSFSLSSAFLILGAINISVMFVCIQFICPPPPGHNIDGIPVIETNSDVHLTLGRSAKNDIPDGLLTAKVISQQPRYMNVLGSERPTIHISLGEALKSRDFWLLYVAFLANIVFCLVILSNLPALINRLFGRESKTPHDPPLEAHIAVSIEGAFNMTGRILVGFISDFIGRKTTFLILLTVQIVALVCIPITISGDHFWLFLILIWIATICYGGGFGMIPAFLSDMFGSSNTSSCHGVFLTAWSIASVGGGLTFTGIVNYYLSEGYKPYDIRPYNVNFAWMMALVIAGFICCLFVRSSIRDRLFPALPDQILRIRIFGRVLRVLWVRGNHVDDTSSIADSVSMNRTVQSTIPLRHGWRRKRLHIELLSKEQEKVAWEEYLFLRAVQYQLLKEPDNVIR